MYGVSPGQPGYVPSGVQQPYAQSPYGTPPAGMPLGVQPNAGGAMGGGYQPQGYPPPAGGYGAPSGGYGNPPQGFGAPPGYSPMVSGASPEAPYGIDPITGLPFSDKQKIVAGLLQIFFGCFGVGRFYIGHTGMGIAQIAVSFLTCGVGTIWPFIDGILMLTGKVTDAQGRPLRDG
jgi:TM2 domain-containing membrane protein YozV